MEWQSKFEKAWCTNSSGVRAKIGPCVELFPAAPPAFRFPDSASPATSSCCARVTRCTCSFS